MTIPRRPATQQQAFELVIDHPQVTDDTTTKEFKTDPNRALRIDRIDYINPTGLAAATPTNFFAIQLKNGSTVLGSWSTLTGAQGTLTADTFVALVLNATDANLVVAPGSTLTLLLDETGAATLPAGKLIVHGRYL